VFESRRRLQIPSTIRYFADTAPRRADSGHTRVAKLQMVSMMLEPF
jgi:hypothetical protein